jgi:hypothetical protein
MEQLDLTEKVEQVELDLQEEQQQVLVVEEAVVEIQQ